MTVTSRPIITWHLGSLARAPQVDDIDFDPTALPQGEACVSLHPHNNDLMIRDTRRPDHSPIFSLGGVDSGYAANLFQLFKGAIKDHLNNAPSQSGCFLPLLLTSCDKQDLALFGYKPETTSPTHHWRWVVRNQESKAITCVPVEDLQAQRHLETLMLGNLNALSFHERNQHLDIKVQQVADRQITAVDVTFKRDSLLCKNALQQFLIDPTNVTHLTTLRHLGLSPEQIQVVCTEEELGYLRAITSSLKSLPEATASTIVGHLKQYYPAQFPILFGELIAEHEQQQQENAYPKILARLQQRVTGQEYASNAVAAALNAQDNSSENAYFLFVGPSGVGKTEMAKAASDVKMERMARFDMDQFKGEVDSNKLFGSPPGYVGCTDRPLFATTLDPFVSKTTECRGVLIKEVHNIVVLFDEIEKAHSEVKQGLLTLFDEGYVKVQYTQDRKNIVTKYVFKKSIFINTSNAYQREILQAFQQGASPSTIEELFITLNAQDNRNPRKFSPELLGRIRKIPFGPIPLEQFPGLVRRKIPSLLSKLQQKVACKTLTIADQHLDRIVAYLSRTLYGDGTGLRKIQEYVDRAIYQTICEQAETWGNYKDKEMAIVPQDQGGLAITCKQTLYGEVIREFPVVPVLSR